MSSDKINPHIDSLKAQLAAGRIGRRDFLRFATLVGMSAAAAYSYVGLARPARAQMPTGGILRIGSRIKEIRNPHTYSWGAWDSNISRQVVEYLSLTDENNVTHPYLLESWEVSPDLKTWTLHVRPGVTWRNGEPFTADDVIWNLQRVLDPAVGSSVIGLMKGYLLEDFDTGEKDEAGNPKMSVRLWDANAIERVDDMTVRLNAKEPQVAVPEHLFHYPLAILYPGDNGVFEPGAQGTGPFELTEFALGQRAVLRAREGYWGDGPYLEGIEFIDMGDDPAAPISAMASQQVHGLVNADPLQYDALNAMPHLQLYQVPTSETAVLRFKVTEPPFDDARVRKALRLAIDSGQIVQVALRGLGLPGEHHHVAPAQPDYAQLPPMPRDVEAARALLAEAGHPDGFDTELFVPADPPWNAAESQAAIEQWEEAGIRVKLTVMPGQEYWNVWTQVPAGCTIWYHRPLGVMVLGLAYRTGVPWNESSYSNPEFDRLLTEAEGTVDLERRRELMAELERIMQEDGPIVQPLWRNNFTFFDKRVQGFSMHPTQYIFGHRLALQQG